MIVLDASAWLEVTLGTASAVVTDRLARDPHWVVPEHFRVEVLNALRGARRRGVIDDAEFRHQADVLIAREFDVWPTVPLVPRIVELADNATSYDAAYVALAEDLGAMLVTADRKFAGIPDIRCTLVGI
ncbi:MAG: type II toxin-antitoxin system VapC family toxin [Pseudolysinimonas sp.]|uniref:type II toxin-antitoxin system VapC family toxin n=1 Tax=Pseudolysinimonas sp. TaxID=2680009 RepID=UPI0032657D80